MHIVGRRSAEGRGWLDQRPLANVAARLRGTRWLVPRGVYRFSSFDEADAWMTDTIRTTHERLTRTTSSASVER